MDEPEYRRRLAALGCANPLVARWEAGYARASHVHSFDAHGLVLQGSFTLTTDDGPRLLAAGDVFELAAGIAHSEVAGPEGALLLVGALAPR